MGTDHVLTDRGEILFCKPFKVKEKICLGGSYAESDICCHPRMRDLSKIAFELSKRFLNAEIHSSSSRVVLNAGAVILLFSKYAYISRNHSICALSLTNAGD